MKFKTLVTKSSLLLLLIFFPQTPAQLPAPTDGSANYVSRVWVADNGDGTYKNPILHADYSDPDAIRVGEDFYLVASSFNSAARRLSSCRTS